MEQIWITGAGIISSIGVGKEETCRSLLEERSGIGELKYLKTEHHEFPVGEVKLTDDEMCQRLNIDKSVPMTRTALMGMLALQEAIADAGLKKDDLKNVGIVSGTTVGGMDKSELYYLDFLENDTRNEYIRTHDCGACTEMIADHFGRFAFATTISTACSSAANAIVLGADMIRNGDAECVIVGGSECITKFHLNGFNSLMILDKEHCRPFDATRAGLNLGEGAAFIVLESESHARRRNCKAKAVLAGYANACDAFHQTASSPDGEGAFRSMTAALQMAGIDHTKIDYINAHGTGTPNNDASESSAIRRIWGDVVPRMSSTKSFTGHTTSASGSIETVICLLAIQNGFIPANLNFSTEDAQCIRPVEKTIRNVKLNNVLCNSFGFGGNDTSIVISSPESDFKFAFAGNNDVQLPYIYSASQISVQSALTDEWFDSPVAIDEPYRRSVDPDFKTYIPPLEARRMGKILKRAIVTSMSALENSGCEKVDAIITGTGLGCIENTEFFLDALSRDGEQLLKPTYFMQSTHNTISSLVGIKMKCNGYNITYAHKELSFESAMYDAWLQFRLRMIDSALVGGHDEMTPSYFKLLEKAGYLGQESELAGETAVSFVIGLKPKDKHLCRFGGIRMMYCPDNEEISRQLHELLDSANIPMDDVSGVLTSMNGNAGHDAYISKLCGNLFSDIPLLRYKHLFGESYTASGLGLYVGATCLSKGRIPESLYVDATSCKPLKPKALLLLNTTDEKCCSLMLVTI